MNLSSEIKAKIREIVDHKEFLKIGKVKVDGQEYKLANPIVLVQCIADCEKKLGQLIIDWVSQLRKIDAPVHLGGYSDGKHIQLVCDLSWVEPKWGAPDEQRTEDSDVHIADDNRLYTFNTLKATCTGCKKHIRSVL